jgi:hypothetical protein
VSWNWVELDGVLGPARWDQRLDRFRLPVAELGLGGIGGVMLGRKYISSVIMASYWSFLVMPNIRPVTNIWVCGGNKGKFVHRGPFLKYAVIGKVCWVRVEVL